MKWLLRELIKAERALNLARAEIVIDKQLTEDEIEKLYVAYHNVSSVLESLEKRNA